MISQQQNLGWRFYQKNIYQKSSPLAFTAIHGKAKAMIMLLLVYCRGFISGSKPAAFLKWAVAWDFQQCDMWDQQNLRSACTYAQSDQSLCKSLKYSMTVKLLAEQHLEYLRLKWGCTGSSESTLVKMAYCWKSRPGSNCIFAVGLVSVFCISFLWYPWVGLWLWVSFNMSCGMKFPTIWHFVKCRLGRVSAASF